ncbi:MAG: response regulator [Pseudomonadota bacterium]
MTSTEILVVDDDPRIRDLLSRYLESEGFGMAAAENGETMRAHMAKSKTDLVMLDLNLPGEDGLSLTREIRATSEIPIIMITGKGDPIDRVIGLEVGADDYIAKPFELREVLARVRAVIRRTANRAQATSTPRDDHAARGYRFDGWRLDTAKRELRDPEDNLIPLSTGEFDLLQLFATHPARVLNRDQLMDMLRGQDWSPLDRSIDTQVGRLRKKIERDPKAPALIKTVRGVGYIFAAKVEAL